MFALTTCKPLNFQTAKDLSCVRSSHRHVPSKYFFLDFRLFKTKLTRLFSFYCHKSCRGRGKCILKTNSCECFNKSDSSVDCQYTDIVGPIMSLQACGDVQRSSATVSCSFAALTIMLLASLVSALTI